MENLTIVKVGGKIVEEEASLKQLLADFSSIEGKKLLVHGGGRSATRMAERLGIATQMVEGRRITDEHRLVYKISGKGPTLTLNIAQCKTHYE